MHIIHISQSLVFLNTRAAPNAAALFSALTDLLSAHGIDSPATTYEIEATVAQVPAEPDAPDAAPAEVPAIVVRVAPYAFVAHGPLADALTAAITAAQAGLAALDAAEAAASAANPPVPQAVSAAGLRVALNAAGLRSAVEAAIAQSDPDAKDLWEYAPEIRRDHPLVKALGTALNLSGEQIDGLFRAAGDPYFAASAAVGTAPSDTPGPGAAPASGFTAWFAAQWGRLFGQS